MGRIAKRVPMGFDWPQGQVWEGYLMPDRLHEADCTACGGEGYSREAQAIANTFYPHMIGYGEQAQALAWHDKIGQDEVDNLIAQGRLRTWRDGAWHADPLTAAEVNARQGSVLDGHDGINRHILIRFRCERLGIQHECSVCEGYGTVEKYPGQRSDAEAWEPTEPPTGDGWQMWETTSEGSPASPVFASADELAEWCHENASFFGSQRASVQRWREVIDGAPAMVTVAPGVMVM